MLFLGIRPCVALSPDRVGRRHRSRQGLQSHHHQQQRQLMSSANETVRSRSKSVSLYLQKYASDDTLIYSIFFILGVGNLLPWFILTNAVLYYRKRFCGEVFENNFEAYYSMSYNIAQPLGLMGVIYNFDKMTYATMVQIPLVVNSLLFAITTLLALIPQIGAVAIFAMTIGTSAMCGMCSSLMNGGLFGMTSLLSPRFTAAAMTGETLAGIIVSTMSVLVSVASTRVNICDDDSSGNSTDTSTSSGDDCSPYVVSFGDVAYFIFATTVCVVCVLLFQLLQHLPQVQERILALSYGQRSSVDPQSVSHTKDENTSQSRVSSTSIINPVHRSQSSTTSEKVADDIVVEKILHQTVHNGSGGGEGDSEGGSEEQQPVKDHRVHFPDDDSAFRLSHSLQLSVRVQDFLLSTHSNHALALSSKKGAVDTTSTLSTLSLLWAIRVPALSVFLIYCISLSIFPPLLALSESTHACESSSRWNNDLWVPLIFLTYNVCDFSGRLTAQWAKDYDCLVNEHNIWIYAVARIALLVLILFCNTSASSPRLPTWNNDVVTFVLVICLGLTNGFFATTAMMKGPRCVSSALAGRAGSLLVCCLVAGLLAGSLLGLLNLFIVTGSA